MATFVETDIRVLLDPSISISPKRYGLPPHDLELNALESGKQRIIDLIKRSDVLVITHYHWDHCPHPESEMISSIRGKTLIVKDYARSINKSQSERGKHFLSKVKSRNEILIGDNKEFEFRNTYIRISRPVWHGEPGSKLGYVLMVYLEHKKDSILFASDIQGVLSNDTFEEIVSFDPKTIIMSGPATYHYFWKDEATRRSNEYLKRIMEKTQVETIVIDHHLTRDINYLDKIKDLILFGEQYKTSIKTAAEFMNKENLLLEARRRELYKAVPRPSYR
jgi:predicted metallo-beta-lactamase superfamily hydrolase